MALLKMKNKYGEFTKTQIAKTKKSLRSSIFFLLLCVDPKTACDYQNIDVNKSFKGLLLKINGLNSLLLEQVALVTVMSLLEAALIEYNNPNFKFSIYRKLILDAGVEIMKLKEE